MKASKHRERENEVIDLGSTVTVMALATAILLAVIVGLGAVTVVPADAQPAAANSALAPSATSEPTDGVLRAAGFDRHAGRRRSSPRAERNGPDR